MITSLQPSAIVGAVLFVAIYGKLFKDFIYFCAHIIQSALNRRRL